jgi:SAM-dependent methyltransferase
MSYQPLLAKVLELADTVKLIGALGAELRLRQMNVAGDPRVRAAVNDMVATLGPDMLDGLDPAQLAVVIGQISYALQEALDLLRNPERAPGWSYDDPTILQDRGRGSAAMAGAFNNLARTRPAFAAVLKGERRFLDIGTGVAWIAIASAKAWPDMQVVGIDIWQPALTLAESNIAAEAMQHRIALRRQSVTEIEDEKAFDLVWMPGMFLPRDVVNAALPRVVKALRPGGMLVFGMYAASSGQHGAAAAKLLTVRSGGYPWTQDELQAKLEGLGLQHIEYVPLTGTTRGVLAQHP